uniref:Uncharacterized protein n=1 Tax=Physcomitrium patens TaxID=3218 RepID=A0A2K1IP50_PHYPA|nr:hypothetical protein PHYPA_027370 [Physcomitrium patens]
MGWRNVGCVVKRVRRAHLFMFLFGFIRQWQNGSRRTPENPDSRCGALCSEQVSKCTVNG